jgi:hypothetical protein
VNVVSTLHFPRRAAWANRVRMLDRTSMSRTALLRSTTGDDVVVLDGGIGVRDGYVDRVAAALLARRRTPPRVVITDSTWTPGPARRAVLRAWDTPRTTYCVLSGEERDRFPASWGVAPERVAVTPFYWTLPEDAPDAAPGGTGVFAGGDSLRDHAALLAAVADLDVPTVVASRARPPAPVPPHVMFAHAHADAVARMGSRARDAVLTKAAPDRYVEQLLDVIDGLPA